jgi:GNAT superfamily N-acetyltransferase
MPLAIKHATPEDADNLAELLSEAETFYGEPEPHNTLAANLREAVFGQNTGIHVLIAYDHTEPLGFAAYSYLWPAQASTRSLFLKELFVRAKNRRTGVGKTLMNQIFTTARHNRCTRVEWTTEHDNEAARRFYQNLGHHPDPTKILYRTEIPVTGPET